MPGNPNKDGRRGPGYQMGRRRNTRVPGYHSVLPRVFPYRWKCTHEQAVYAICDMLDVGRDGFALTSHPTTKDGHVHLWLSAENAEYLVETLDMVQPQQLEATE